jgi:hypothetical protein
MCYAGIAFFGNKAWIVKEPLLSGNYLDNSGEHPCIDLDNSNERINQKAVFNDTAFLHLGQMPSGHHELVMKIKSKNNGTYKTI